MSFWKAVKKFFSTSDYHLGTSSEPRPFPMQTEAGDYESHLDFLEMHGCLSAEEIAARDEAAMKKFLNGRKPPETFEEFVALFKGEKK